MNHTWPLSRTLLMEILADRISDKFVCRLVWERLEYERDEDYLDVWHAGPNTNGYWKEVFLDAPEIISERYASVHLTRNIKKEY